MFHGPGQSIPAAFPEFAVGFLPAGWQDDFSILEDRLMLIADSIERSEFFSSEASRLFKDCTGGCNIEIAEYPLVEVSRKASNRVEGERNI